MDHNPMIPDLDPRRQSVRVFSAQLGIVTVLAVLSSVAFCCLRRKWPKFYAMRSLHLPDLPALPESLFGWLAVVYRISDEEVLQFSGLDAYVFLGFFKMAIQLLTCYTVAALFILSPLRFYFTGRLDSDGPNATDASPTPENGNYPGYFWAYGLFVYIFSAIAIYLLLNQTTTVIRVRQEYLGNQATITDRTIRLSGIPRQLRDESVLRDHIESFRIGKVASVTLCHDWAASELRKLFVARGRVLRKLERYLAEYLGVNVVPRPDGLPAVRPRFIPREIDRTAEPFIDPPHLRFLDDENIWNPAFRVSETPRGFGAALGPSGPSGLPETETDPLLPLRHRAVSAASSGLSASSAISATSAAGAASASGSASASASTSTSGSGHRRPTIRRWLGIFGPKIDAISYYTQRLAALDEEITARRSQPLPPVPEAFVTMDSVASAQMLAQAVLDPRVGQLIATLAPAPQDVQWDSLCLSRTSRFVRQYAVTLVIAVFTVAWVFPVSSIAALLNVKTLKKLWPALGNAIADSKWANTLICGILPPYLFTLLSVCVPYFYEWLAELQGYVSSGEQEISVVSKNYFFTFFNLFFVFTLAGTASNYTALLTDSTKIAYLLAAAIRDLSLFYADLVLLQGIGLMPFRLLQLGTTALSWMGKLGCRTARDYRELYIAAPFDFGLVLPPHILILVIVVMYSVLSTKIVCSGLAYFVLGYFVYKYQLVYAMESPRHSTGQAWPLIFRRVCSGLLLFQIAMAGTFALRQAFVLAVLMIPLLWVTGLTLYRFEKDYEPLMQFIALRSIRADVVPALDVSAFFGTAADPIMTWSDIPRANAEDSVPKRRKRKMTLDETREQNQMYSYPYLDEPLEGPWVGFDGSDVLMLEMDDLQGDPDATLASVSSSGRLVRRRVEWDSW